MPAEGASRRKFTQFMPDHIFRDVDRYMPPAIMHGNRMADHLRKDRTRPAPGADDDFLVLLVQPLDLFQQLGTNVVALLQ